MYKTYIKRFMQCMQDDRKKDRRGLTSKAECICPEDKGGKVSQAPNSCTDCYGDVTCSVLVWQILPAKVLADVGAEEEEQVGEESCLNGTPA